MNKNNKSVITSPCMGQLRFWLLLLTLVFFGNAWGGECPGGHHNIDFGAKCDGQSDSSWECTYAITYNPAGGTPVTETIGLESNAPNPATATFGISDQTGRCDPSPANKWCFARNATPLPSERVNITFNTNTVSLTDNAYGNLNEEGIFVLNATSDALTCNRKYNLHITSAGGGWGDPHITTVDGIHYDFQSAGEFIALRGNDGLEIQTRQTAVSKQGVLGANPYTGIASCVSIYTAVAAKVGQHRVTIQPNLNGEPDPSGLQLRVDGKLRVLGPDGIDLDSCNCDSDETLGSGRIVKSADDKGFEIRYANGTKLVVTPAWWQSQQKWYLNVNVYDTTATEGIMGRIAKGSWLPSLSDGDTVGPKAAALPERYGQLYKTFADSWRVGGSKPSLFDYAPGTSTQTFTFAEWPRENPPNCLFAGPGAVPADESVTLDESVAKEHCLDVEDENNRANCVIDVAATGHTGFADAYVRAEQVTPGATKTSILVNKTSSRPGKNITFTAVVMRKASTIAKVTSGRVQFVLDGNEVGGPMALDSNGNALWSTSNLQRGTHEIEARFLPSGFGERFRTSNSLKVSHSVSSIASDLELSFHLGANTPHGSLSSNFDGDIGYAFDIEYRLSHSYSLLLFAGKNQFDNSTAELDITNLSINGKHYYGSLAKHHFRYFSNAGIGFYSVDPGDDDLGLNIGGGAQYQLDARYGLEAWYNYHHIISSPNSTDFSTLQFGGYYHF